MEKALFLDLDRTIITTKSGKKFAEDKDDWKFVDGMVDILKKFQDDGYRLFIVSNQAGIEAGYVTEKDVVSKLDEIIKELKHNGVNIIKYYYSTSKSDKKRKPEPTVAYMARDKFNLNLENSIMVGDMDSDAGFAKNAGMKYYNTKDFLKINL